MKQIRAVVIVGLCGLLLAACIPLPIQVSPPSAPFTETMVTFELRDGGPLVNSPSWRLILYGDGTVVYEGRGIGIVEGRQTTNVDPVHVDALLYEFGKLDFLDLEGLPEGAPPESDADPLDYLFPLDEFPPLNIASMTVGLKIGDRHKAVFANLPAAPAGMGDLIYQIHVEADAMQWVSWFFENSFVPFPTHTPDSPLPSPTP